MKLKFYSLFLIVFMFAQSGIAQVSPGFNYQAIMRDSSGVISNEDVTIRFSVISEMTSETVFSEQHLLTTDAFGLVKCAIGLGDSISGGFDDIMWGADQYSIKVELKRASDSEFTSLGVNELSAVPYAMYAKVAESITHVDGMDLQVTNTDGALRADLNYYDNNDAGSLVLYGANDSTKAILGTLSSGYAGGLWLYDSTRNATAQLYSWKNGGSVLTNRDANGNAIGWFGSRNANGGIYQITEYDNNNMLTGAAGAYLNNGKPFWYLETAVDGEYKTLVEAGGNEVGNYGIGGFFTLRGPALSDGSWPKDIVSMNTASNDIGYSAEMFLWGDNSPNIQMGAPNWQDNNLSFMQFFGSIQNTDGWYPGNLILQTVKEEESGFEAGAIDLFRTEGADTTENTIHLDGMSGSATFSGSIQVNGDLNVDGNINADVQPAWGEDFQIKNNNGALRADLNYYENNDAGSLVLYGANDSTKAILGSTYNGYAGGLWLYDSTRVNTMRIQSLKNGGARMLTYDHNNNHVGWFGNITSTRGIFQVSEYDDDSNYLGSIGGYMLDSKPYFYLETAVNNEFKTIGAMGGSEIGEHGIGGTLTLRGPALSDGSWPTDIFRVSSAANDSSYAGELLLHGRSTPNFQLGGQTWENTELPYLNMFGSIQNNDEWYHPAAYLGVGKDGNSGNEFGVISLYNVVDTNTINETIKLDGASGYAHFSGEVVTEGKTTIKDVLKLEPRSTEPSNPEAGQMYFDSNTSSLKLYNGTEWKTVSLQ